MKYTKFSPSITENLSLKALEFARTYTDIDDDTTSIMLHCRKSVLFDSKGTWIKKMVTYSTKPWGHMAGRKSASSSAVAYAGF